MTEPEISESHRSWRAKSWLMITEGRKAKVSNRLLQITIWIIGLLVLILQGSSVFKPSIKKSAEMIFVPSDLRPPSTSVYVPKVMDRNKDLQDEKEKAREIVASRLRGAPAIERIQAINLNIHQGVPAGSEVLVTLVSGGTNGMVKASLTEPLRVDGDVILPARTVLMGSGTSTEDRLFMEFSKAILPDKSAMRIKALAYDQGDRIIGVKGKKISDYAFKLATSSGLIFLGGMADGMREEVNLGMGERRKPSVRDAALSGVATATSEVGKDMLEKMKSSDNRVEVAHSTSVLVIFDDVPTK